MGRERLSFAVKGIKAIGRLYEIAIWIIPIIIAFGLFFGEAKFTEIYLTPIFNENLTVYTSTLGKYLIYAFDFSPLLFVRLKVKGEFKKDISASDLPTQSETLDLAFTVNYTQADETGTGVPNNGKEPFKPTIISGDLNTVGSEVAIGDEHFYIISNTDGKIAMLSKYNLYVGNECTSSSSSSCTPYGEEATGIQDETMKGLVSNQQTRNGTTPFSSTNYWSSTVSSYPAYVYDSNSTLYNYVESYRTYLESQGAEIEEARLIKYEELEALGCSASSCSCKSAPEWVYGTTYWSGAAFDSSNVWSVHSDDDFYEGYYSSNYSRGVRPVIVLKS